MSEQVGTIERTEDGLVWVKRTDCNFDDVNQDDVGINPAHEMEVLHYLKKIANKNMIFIDIGAHVGYYSVRLSSHFNTVYAFEPNLYNVKALKINMIMNDLCNVKTIPAGCSDKRESVTLYHRGGSSFTDSSDADIDTKGLESFKVVLMPLDYYSVVYKPEQPVIIKVDTEGAEMKVLHGAKRMLEHDKSLWIIEHHEGIYKIKGRRQTITDFMSGRGFVLVSDDITGIKCKDQLVFRKRQ